MKTLAIGSIFVLFAIVGGISTVPSAFADHAEASVDAAVGSSVPGCEATNECYIPATVTIDVGGEVTWNNPDTAAHTVTSGTPEDGPDGHFDSSLFMAGASYSVKFDDYEPGDYPYFCMVHPWMVGIVTVQAAGMEDDDKMMEDDDKMMMEGTEIMSMSMDGSITVKITANDPIQGERMDIKVEFMDEAGNHVEHINHDISATQNGANVLDDMGAHHHEGMGMHMTAPLASDDPVDVKVTLQGIGVNAPFTGPQGDVVEFTVVPEFGTIAIMILGVAIISIIAVTARSKIGLVPKI